MKQAAWVFLSILSFNWNIGLSAAILTAENEKELCVAKYDGRPAVDKDVLAYVIASEAGAGRYLDGANMTGLRDNAIQLRSTSTVPSEPAYVMLNLSADPDTTRNRPFGPNVDPSQDKRAAAAITEIYKVLGQELFKIADIGQTNPDKGFIYRIKRRNVVGAPTDDNAWRNPMFLFLPEPPLVILCDAAGDMQLANVPDNARPTSIAKPFLMNDFLLRGTVSDLTVPTDQLKTAKPATIGYTRDIEEDTRTFTFNGVAGFRFGDDAGTFDLIPFISYENRSVTGTASDIDKVSPGLLFGYRLENPSFALHTSLEAAYLRDIEQHAQQGKLRLYVEPAFALRGGRGVLFGSYLDALGPLQIRPDLKLIADGSHVFRRGTSEILKAQKIISAWAESSRSD